MSMDTITVKHVSSGHIYTAQLYTSFAYLLESMRVISIEDFNDFFEVVPTTNDN